MKLYTYFRSSAAFRIRIALNLKSIAWDAVYVNLLSGEQREKPYVDLNPQGLIPSLQLDGGVVLAQSLAILEYLEETHPEPPLLPSENVDRAKVRAMAAVIACDIHPLNNLRVLKYLKNEMGHDQEELDVWYRHWIAEGFAALEAMTVATAGTYCFGDMITLADVCLVPQMWNARRFETDMSPYPRLTAIDDRLKGLAAFSDAAPENQPDFA